VDWPFFDLRVTCGRVVLRAVTDADLALLLSIYPPDAEQDPGARPLAGLDEARDRDRLFVQGVWANRGAWSPDSWCLDLAVEIDDVVVGLQSLEGDTFPVLRTVDTGSWLARAARGHGTATEMRTAALALGFGPLGAVAAVSSARIDNAPSLAVSRRLGYAENGNSLTNSPTGVVQLQHLRLTRERWLADEHRVEISGADACLPWFGLGPREG